MRMAINYTWAYGTENDFMGRTEESSISQKRNAGPPTSTTGLDPECEARMLRACSVKPYGRDVQSRRSLPGPRSPGTPRVFAGIDWKSRSQATISRRLLIVQQDTPIFAIRRIFRSGYLAAEELQQQNEDSRQRR